MKKKYISILLVGVFLFIACGKETSNEIDENATAAEESEVNDEETTIEPDEDENNLESYADMKYFCLSDTYDVDDDETLKRGMWGKFEDEKMEKEFLSFFFTDSAAMQVIEDSFSKVYMGNIDGEQIFVAEIKNDESEFPKSAYGFKYSLSDAVAEAQYDPSKKGEDVFDTLQSLDGKEYEYTDFLKPLLDYQEKNYIKDDNGVTIKVEYKSDAQEYGTYNSSGDLYLDKHGRGWCREYYVTSGKRFTYYFYNEDDELTQIIDFGGMPYKGLEENKDIAIGVDLKLYLFERNESTNYDDQLETILGNRNMWEIIDSQCESSYGEIIDLEDYGYTISDLDGDGKLEIISSAWAGTGHFSLNRIFEYKDENTLEEFDLSEFCYDDSEPDLLLQDEINDIFSSKNDSIEGFVDEDGIYNYIVSDKEYWQSYGGRTRYFQSKIIDNKITSKLLAYKEKDEEIDTYYDDKGEEISEEEFEKILDSVVSDRDIKQVTFNWFYYVTMDNMKESLKACGL